MTSSAPRCRFPVVLTLCVLFCNSVARQRALEVGLSSKITRHSLEAQRLVEPLLECGARTVWDLNCVRILEGKQSTEAGLGHQLSELVFFAKLSQLHGAALRFSPFTAAISNHFAEYAFVNDLLGLRRLTSNTHVDTTLLREVRFNESASEEECGVLYTGDYRSCPGGNCFEAVTMARAFEQFAPCLRVESYRTGSWWMHNPYREHTFAVVWHVRVGDITPHLATDPFFSNILKGIEGSLKHVPNTHHFVVGNWAVAHAETLKGFKSMFKRLFVNHTYDLLDLDIRSTLLHLLHADVLIGTGSSLTSTIPLFSGKPLVFNVKPKHGWNHLAEYYSDGIDVSPDGHILTPKYLLASLLKARSTGQPFKRSVGKVKATYYTYGG